MLKYIRLLETSKKNEEIENKLIKVLYLIILLGISIGFSFMPYFITSCRKNYKLLSYSNSFSAGMFLSLGLIHILPESAEMLHPYSDLPLSYIFCFISYSFILFIEKIFFNSHSLIHKKNHNHNHNNHKYENNSLYEDNKLKDEDDNSEGNIKEKEEYIRTNENKKEFFKNTLFEVKINQKKDISSFNNIGTIPLDLNVKENKINKKDNMDNSIVTSFFLLFALGFHGLFEGISLGIQSTIRKSLFLFLAIVLHKWAGSLSLGISFVKTGIGKKNFIIMILIFASMTPLGIFFGMILKSLSSNILSGIFLSISVGTFIYIACSEIVIEEFSNHEFKYSKFLLYLLGAGLVIGLSFIETCSEIEHRHNDID